MADYGAAAINAGAGIFSSLINNIYGAMRESDARHENFVYGEEAANNADARTRKLYADLYGPEAQLQQIKNAGLSPSLFYGNAGGISGQAGAQGTGATGISPNVFGMSPIDIAQIRLMDAQANKANADADATKEKLPSEIAQNWANAGAAQAAAAYTKTLSAWQNIQNSIADTTKPYSIRRIQAEAKTAEENASKAFYEAEDAGLTWQWNLASYEQRLSNLANEGAKYLAEISYMHTGEILAQAEIKKIKEEIELIKADTQAHADNATNYGNYVEAYAENLPKQLDLRKDEIKLEKWKIGVGAFTEVIKTIGYMAGASQLGDGGYTDSETTEYTTPGGSTSRKVTNKRHVKLPKRLP